MIFIHGIFMVIIKPYHITIDVKLFSGYVTIFKIGMSDVFCFYCFLHFSCLNGLHITTFFIGNLFDIIITCCEK